MFKLKIPDCDVHYTGDYVEDYPSTGKLYCFNVRVKGKRDLAFRISSKDPKYKTLYGIHLLSKKMKPVIGILVENQNNDPSPVFASRVLYHIIQGAKQPIKESSMEMETVVVIIQLLVSLITILSILYYYKMKLDKARETSRGNNLENEINKELFQGQTGKESEFDIYHGLIQSIETVIKSGNKINSLIVCGIPGTSKTHIVRRTLYFNGLKSPQDYTILKGSAMSMLDFMQALYDNRNKILILDDFDTPLENPETVNILKSTTDSYSRKIVSFPRAMAYSQQGGTADYNIPDKFEFAGKLIIITNKQFKDIDKALVSRCLVTEVNFTLTEFLDAINKMLKYMMPNVDMSVKLEVYDYISSLAKKGKLNGLNFRTFQNCVSVRLLYPENWKNMIDYIIK